jgi:hypothetical protein
MAGLLECDHLKRPEKDTGHRRGFHGILRVRRSIEYHCVAAGLFELPEPYQREGSMDSLVEFSDGGVSKEGITLRGAKQRQLQILEQQ